MRANLERVIAVYSQPQAVNTLGVCLLDVERMKRIWKEQAKHLACIHDPPGLPLYIQAGTQVKGGKLLKTFRCARDSTSLESFHLHLNRFIPGKNASDCHFATYLLEGLSRWNQDRTAAIHQHGQLKTYCLKMQFFANEGLSAIGKELAFPQLQRPLQYTGELIGMEYLSAQTASRLDMSSVDVEADDTSEDEGVEEDEEEEPLVDDSITLEPGSVFQDASEGALTEVRLPRLPLSLPEPPALPTELPPMVPTNRPSSPLHLPQARLSVMKLMKMLTSTKGFSEQAVCQAVIPGYGQVQELVEAIVALKDDTYLTPAVVDKLTRLYRCLSEHDRRPIAFPPRYQHSLQRGRFGRPKTDTAPGVESTRRYFLSSYTGPAQKPDVNRVTEAVVDRLCHMYPNDLRRPGRATVSRWSRILGVYKRLRQLLMGNARLMQQIPLQLPEINQRTLTQWHNRLLQRLEDTVLSQGVTEAMVSRELQQPAERAMQPQRQVPAGGEECLLQFKKPPRTVGQAKKEKRRKRTRPVEQSLPIYAGPQRLASRPPTFLYLPPASLQERGTLLYLPAVVVQHSTPSGPTVAGTSVASAIGSALSAPSASSASVSAPSAPSAQAAVPSATAVVIEPTSATVPAIQVTSTPKTTAWRRKKQERGRMERKQAPRRPFRCFLCQKERAGGHHRQYYGAWWCGEASSQSYEAWVEERKRVRTERQRESP